MMLTAPKTGVTLEISFARFRPSMATFNAVSVLSCSLYRWEFEDIVEGRGIWEDVDVSALT
jgi:hypothetical protein